MKYQNKMKLKFDSIIENENFARLAVASFCSLKITDIETLSDIKTAVSEAITNCIVHGYDGKVGDVDIECILNDTCVTITIQDYGVGIQDIDTATMPFFTTKPDKERSGMGFTVMEGFMDDIVIESQVGVGTKIVLIKYFNM